MEKREIKFRAWNERDKLMCEPFGVRHGGLMWRSKQESAVTYKALMPEDILLQWTGLKDKNGVEIYEGDLLRYPGDSEHFTAYEVFFHDGDANSDFNIGYSCGRTHHQGSICGGPIPSFKPKSVAQMEICGNIFQNPELLTR